MPKLWEALVTMLILVGALALGIVKYETDPHVPMFIGVMGAALMALYLGYKWEAIEKSMMDGIYKALQSVCILVIVGILIGVWINAGVVPTMIFYGLKVLKPAIFFIHCVCSHLLHHLSGHRYLLGHDGYDGRRLDGHWLRSRHEPRHDRRCGPLRCLLRRQDVPAVRSTNLAPAMAGTDVMTHVKAMILPTGITYVITLIGFGILGAMQYHGGDADMSRVTEFSGALEAVFNINPALLLPPVIVIVAVAMKMPAIPGITLGIISGAIMGMIFQPECNMGTVFDFGMNGYYFSDEVLAMFEETLSPETSYTMTRLLESGGILGMMSSVAMTIIAMMFGGIMEDTHQLEVIVNSLKKLAKGPAGLVLLTECTCVLSNAVMPEQYISIVVPGRMYAEEYREKGLHPALLSGALEGAGTVTSALIPWNTCGVFISSTLDINAWGAGGYVTWAFSPSCPSSVLNWA